MKVLDQNDQPIFEGVSNNKHTALEAVRLFVHLAMLFISKL